MSYIIVFGLGIGAAKLAPWAWSQWTTYGWSWLKSKLPAWAGGA